MWGPPRGAVMVERWNRPLVALVAALAFLVAAEAGWAGTDTVQDANDVAGKLDIRSVSQGHAGTKVVHTIRTFSNWPLAVLAPRTPNYFLLEFNTDADAAPERSALIFSSGGHMVAALFGPSGRFLAQVGASRPNGHTVRVSIALKRLGNPAGYRWQAFSFYRAAKVCHPACRDRAPNGSGRILHDLRKPTISFPQPGVPAAADYDVDFSVSDTGGSGIAGWRLENRLFGTVGWTTVADGTSAGAHTYHHVAAQDQDDQFRVVAFDGHGNTRTSVVRTVSVPVDDPSFTYGGTWTTGGSPDDFLGTLHLSSEANATATYIFDGAYVALVAPGGAGTIEVRIDGALQKSVDLSGFSGPRQIVFQKSFPHADEQTLEVTVAGGTVPIDGLIVR